MVKKGRDVKSHDESPDQHIFGVLRPASLLLEM